MKSNIPIVIGLVFTLLVVNATSSFSEDYFSLPSCYSGSFYQDHVQCSTKESPPCSEPSFEKNGYCVVKKMDICKPGNVLDDGKCIDRDEFFRVDDPSFSRQSLQTGETLGDISNTFGWFGIILSSFIVFSFVVMKIKKRRKNQS